MAMPTTDVVACRAVRLQQAVARRRFVVGHGRILVGGFLQRALLRAVAPDPMPINPIPRRLPRDAPSDDRLPDRRPAAWLRGHPPRADLLGGALRKACWSRGSCSPPCRCAMRSARAAHVVALHRRCRLGRWPGDGRVLDAVRADVVARPGPRARGRGGLAWPALAPGMALRGWTAAAIPLAALVLTAAGIASARGARTRPRRRRADPWPARRAARVHDRAGHRRARGPYDQARLRRRDRRRGQRCCRRTWWR